MRISEIVLENRYNMINWKMNEEKLEGKAEIYLKWKNLLIFSVMLIIPFVIALYVNSIFIKAIYWLFAFLDRHLRYLQIWNEKRPVDSGLCCSSCLCFAFKASPA